MLLQVSCFSAITLPTKESAEGSFSRFALMLHFAQSFRSCRDFVKRTEMRKRSGEDTHRQLVYMGKSKISHF